MTSSFEGKVALVTGGSSGIGRATAMAFAREGARVVIGDVHADQGMALEQDLEKSGRRALFVKADMAFAGDVENMVSQAVSAFGRIDFAFNNAGIEGRMASTAECTEDNFDRVISVNLRGVWLCLRAEIRQMLRQREGGAIVNMSSVAGQAGFASLPAYVASKHGVIGLTRTAALECATKNIRVNAVCPGVIHTAMVDRITGRDPKAEAEFTALEPLGRMGTASEVAEAVIWLCSPGASFVTGHALAVDGGFLAR